MKKKPVAVVLGDIHWRTNTPEYRRETCPFNEVIARKLHVVADTARKMDVRVLVTGDLFDKSREFMDMWTMREFLRKEFFTTDKSPVEMWAVRGQHDMFHHNPQDTATSFNTILTDADSRLFLMPPDGLMLGTGSICVYGAGWGDEIPVPAHPSLNNILLLHKTLWHQTPVYPGQTAGNVSAESVRLHELGYKMVFSGDNHKAFDVKVGGVEFHNLGAFTRQDVTLDTQQPRFMILYDDMTMTTESVYVGEENVFEMERSDADKERGDMKDEFSIALAGGFVYGETFKNSLQQIVTAGKCGDAVFTDSQLGVLRDIINSI